MLTILQDMCPQVESYSIDESFMNLAGYADPTVYGYSIRARLQQDIKITCGVGIGPTKTLSKFANHLAKKNAEFGGVFNTLDHSPEELNHWMAAYLSPPISF